MRCRHRRGFENIRRHTFVQFSRSIDPQTEQNQIIHGWMNPVSLRTYLYKYATVLVQIEYRSILSVMVIIWDTFQSRRPDQLTSLEELDLDHNGIESLSFLATMQRTKADSRLNDKLKGPWRKKKNMTLADESNAEIFRFVSLPCLRSVSLATNMISMVDIGVELQSVREIQLSDNPNWTSTCFLLWNTEMLHTVQVVTVSKS